MQLVEMTMTFSYLLLATEKERIGPMETFSRLFGPAAHSQFVKRPGSGHCLESKLERTYRRADAAIDRVVEVLPAA